MNVDGAARARAFGVGKLLFSQKLTAAPVIYLPPRSVNAYLAVQRITARQRRAPTDAIDAPAPAQLHRLLAAPPLAAALARPAGTVLAAATLAVATAAGRARTRSTAGLVVAATAAAAAAALSLTALTKLAAAPVAGGILTSVKHTGEELQTIRHPPQLPHIFSIYRNAM